MNEISENDRHETVGLSAIAWFEIAFEHVDTKRAVGSLNDVAAYLLKPGRDTLGQGDTLEIGGETFKAVFRDALRTDIGETRKLDLKVI